MRRSDWVATAMALSFLVQVVLSSLICVGAAVLPDGPALRGVFCLHDAPAPSRVSAGLDHIVAGHHDPDEGPTPPASHQAGCCPIDCGACGAMLRPPRGAAPLASRRAARTMALATPTDRPVLRLGYRPQQPRAPPRAA